MQQQQHLLLCFCWCHHWALMNDEEEKENAFYLHFNCYSGTVLLLLSVLKVLVFFWSIRGLEEEEENIIQIRAGQQRYDEDLFSCCWCWPYICTSWLVHCYFIVGSLVRISSPSVCPSLSWANETVIRFNRFPHHIIIILSTLLFAFSFL